MARHGRGRAKQDVQLGLACAGVEVDGVISVLCILPKLDVAMIEHVGMQVHVVEALRGEHHAHVIPRIEEWQCLIEELDVCNLRMTQRLRHLRSDSRILHSSFPVEAMTSFPRP